MKLGIILLILFFYLLKPSCFAQKTMLAYNYNRYNSALATNNIYKIICDNKGGIWISTDRGVTYYNGDHFKNYNQLIDNEIVNLFYENKTARLFALTYNSKLLEINTQTKKFQTIPSKDRVSGSFMYGYKNQDSLFFLTSTQKFKLLGGKLIQVPVNSQVYKEYLDNVESKSPFTPIKFYKEIPWEYVFKKDIKSKLFASKNFFRIGKYNTISVYGKIFIQHKKRYYTIIDSTQFRLEKNQFITDIEIIKNDFYISVYGANGGVFLAKNFFSNPRKAIFKRVSEVGNCTSICKDKLNNIWYSLLGKGLFVICKPELNIQTVNIKNVTQDNNQFVALNDTIVLFKEGSSEFSRIMSINSNTGIVKTINNNSQNFALKKYYSLLRNQDVTPYKDISHDKRMVFIKDYIKYHTPDNKEQIILTHKNKIYRKGDYFENTVILYAENDSIYSYNLSKKRIERQVLLAEIGPIKDIYFLNNSNVFICANNGVFKTDTSFKFVTKLSDKVFKKILVNKNMVFFSNDKVIEYMDLSENKIKQVFNVQFFSPNFSILDFDLSANKIHLLTNIGYVNLDLSIISAKPTYVSFNLEEIILKNGIIHYPSNIIDIDRLHANEIKFIIQYLNPENKFYEKSYSFTKKNDAVNWKIFTEDNFVQTNVSPGNYILKIKTRFSDSVPDKILSYEIRIKPAFWETTWFFIVSVILSTITVIFITWFIIKNKVEKKLAKVILEKHILEIENRAFLNQLNPHFLFNALNTLQDYIIRKDTHNGILYLQHVASLHRNILQFNTKLNISVTEEIDFLEKYLFVQKKRFSDKFTFDIQVNPNAKKLKLPPMLLQPFVENTIEHGFANQDLDKQITIDFRKINSHLIIKITDNGSGNVETILPFKEGHALHMINERLGFINIKKKSIINRIDFIQNHPKGIIVMITIDLE